MWGLLAVYLINVVNPKIDLLLDKIKAKFNGKILKIIIVVFIIFLFVDCIVSGIALDFYFTRIIVENDLDVANKDKVIEKYNYLYLEDQERADLIYKVWGNEIMIKKYPNVTIRLKNGELVLAKKYLPDIKPYYIKFKR